VSICSSVHCFAIADTWIWYAGPAYTLESEELWHLLAPYRALLPRNPIEIGSAAPPIFRVRDYSSTSSELSNLSTAHSSSSYQHLRRPALTHYDSSDAIYLDNGDQSSSKYSPESNISMGADYFNVDCISDIVHDFAQNQQDQHQVNDTPLLISNGVEADMIPQTVEERDRRKEQNRVKSKRHRDKMVQQRNLLLDIMGTIGQVCHRPNYRITSEIGQKIYSVVMDSSDDSTKWQQPGSEGRRQQDKERQRRSKAMQRSEELERFKQVYLIASHLLQEKIDAFLAFDLLMSSQSTHIQGATSDLHTFLGILVSFQSRWDTLVEAESRLHVCTPNYPGVRRPIADLVNRLKKALDEAVVMQIGTSVA
jgi:hypothetical protein